MLRRKRHLKLAVALLAGMLLAWPPVFALANDHVLEARQMGSLLHPPLVESAHMNPGRWRRIADTYAELGLVKADLGLRGFLYDLNPLLPNLKWLYGGLAAALGLVLAAGLIAVRSVRLSARLKSQIADNMKVDQALRESEGHYRGLFEHMAEGCCYCRMIIEDGQPRDFVYLTVNSAFETLTGLRAVTGQKVSAVIPGIRESDPRLFDFYARVALTGRSEKLEVFVAAMKMWFSISAYSPETGCFVAVFDVITPRKEAEQALRVEQENLQAIFASSPVGMLLLDEDTMIVDANSVLARMVSRNLSEVLQQRGGGGLGCVHSFEDERGCGFGAACPTCPLRQCLTDVLATGNSVHGAEIQATLLIEGQEYRPWLSVSAEPVVLNGRRHIIVAIDDITVRRHAQEELLSSVSLLNAALEATADGILVVDRHGAITRWNSKFADMWRIPQELLGKHDDQKALACVMGQLAQPNAFMAKVDDMYAHPEATSLDQLSLADGRIFQRHSQPQRIGQEIVGRVWSFQDITERIRAENELRAAARTDKLTGLPNRALFCDRLQQAVWRAKRHSDFHFAVLFLDFDRFKAVNDSLGHNVGDLLLQEIGRRLCLAVRSGDSLSRETREHTAARLGGDEFVVLLDGLAHPDDAIVVAHRLLETFAQPYYLGDHEVYSTASIGIVTTAMLADSADEVLRDADTAMYEAKLAGKGQYVVFDVSMRERVQSRLNMENDLRRAVENNELFLMYQPIVCLHTGQIVSFEALVRWRHPWRGVISPAEFIPVAEDTGLILPIGAWVLREACRQFAQWRTSAGAAAPRSISVNLSRHQLDLPDLPATIREILAQTGMTPGCLHLEVTESAVMKDAASAAQRLRAIKDIGVKLDMDDFGTGYSSLACLHQFPFDTLKIDRSFIAKIHRGRDFAALVHAVVQLARNLSISVVAEGIENLEQAMVLQSLDCELGQGYLFSKPLYAAEVPDFRVHAATLPGARAPAAPAASMA